MALAFAVKNVGDVVVVFVGALAGMFAFLLVRLFQVPVTLPAGDGLALHQLL